MNPLNRVVDKITDRLLETIFSWASRHKAVTAVVVVEGDAALLFGPSFLAGPVSDLDLPESARPQPRGFPRLAGAVAQVFGGEVAVVPHRVDQGSEVRGLAHRPGGAQPLK